MPHSPSFRSHAVCSLALGAALACAGAGAASAQEVHVVADGLSNPRGLAFGPGGHLYVAESGRGGAGACLPAPGGPPQCYGATGAIARVKVGSGRVTRIVRRLPSLAPQEASEQGPAGAGATGPNDVSFRGRIGYFVVGLAADPARRGELGRAGRRFAVLYRLDRRGRVRRVADLGAYEQRANPDQGQPTAGVDSNPYSLDATRGGRILVTDAGGNDLLGVGRSGRIRTLAVFPFRQTPAPPQLGAPAGTVLTYQPVPTGVARGRGGSVYVGELTGFPFPAGAANVFRVSASGGTPTVQADGFTTIVDVAYGRGNLYVLQYASGTLAGPPTPGRLVRIAPDGTETELAPGRLEQPSGLTVARSGDVYVANKGSSPSDAEILHIEG